MLLAFRKVLKTTRAQGNIVSLGNIGLNDVGISFLQNFSELLKCSSALQIC